MLAVASLAVAGVVGLGGWAALTLLSGGTQPSEAVPADAVGYVSLDLDPSASQKIEAFKILKKFPAIDEEMEVSSQDDLRRWVFEQLQEEEGVCESLDYGKDIEPWIGDRIAFAGVPTGQDGELAPLVALQVTDQEGAEQGITALAECAEADEEFGFAFTDDYVLMSDSEDHATTFAAKATEAPLAEDADFQKWTSKVGDPGIVTMYAAPGAMNALIDMQTDLQDEMFELTSGTDEAMLQAQSEMDRMNERLKSVYKDFKGMAAVVRFQDGAVEAEFAMDGTSAELAWVNGGGPSHVTELPAGTAAAVSVGLPDGWLDGYVDLMKQLIGEEVPVDRMIAELEAQSGLAIPEDIETLLGESTSLAVDADLDLAAAEQDPTGVPAGVRVTGDTAEITRVVDKLRALMGPDAQMLVVEEGDGVVALGLNRDYVSTLAEGGSLGDDATFQDAVPEADRTTSVLYLDFDVVERWVEQTLQASGPISPEDQKVLDNLEPLAAAGASSWMEEDGTVRGLYRVTTD